MSKEVFDNKYPKATWIYHCRRVPGNRNKKANIAMDVRSFIFEDDMILKDVVRRYNLKDENIDKTALNCQNWVVNNIKYVSDMNNEGYTEFWQFPNETVQLGLRIAKMEVYL